MSRVDRAKQGFSEHSGSNFLNFFKFPDGKCDIRILPPEKGADKDDWFTLVGVHYDVSDKPLTCPNETYWAKDPCPICELVQELRTGGDDNEAKKLAVRRSYYVRAIVRGEEEKGAQLVRLPVTLFKTILEIKEDEEAFGEILHLVKGRDIRVVKEGSGMKTTYQAQALPKQRPVLGTKEAILALWESLGDIDEIIHVETYDGLKTILEESLGISASGMGATADDDDDDYDIGDLEEAEAVEEDDDPIDIDDVDDFTVDDDDAEEEEADELDIDDLDVDDFDVDDDDDDDLPSVSEAAKAAQAEMKSGLANELKSKGAKVAPKRAKSRGKKE